MSPVPAAAVLAALAVAALLAGHTLSVAALCLLLLVAAWRAPAQRRWPYLIGTLSTGLTVFLITPFVEVIGTHVLWTGPTIPVVGTLDIRTEELRNGLFQGLRVTAVGLAFAVYALLLDHDRLLAAAGWARRSTLAVALATRLVPVLERDGDRRAARPARGGEQAVVVEQQCVDSEREADGPEAQALEETVAQLLGAHVEPPDHRDRRACPEHMGADHLDERRDHHEENRSRKRADQIGPASLRRRAQRDKQQQRADRADRPETRREQCGGRKRRQQCRGRCRAHEPYL